MSEHENIVCFYLIGQPMMFMGESIEDPQAPENSITVRNIVQLHFDGRNAGFVPSTFMMTGVKTVEIPNSSLATLPTQVKNSNLIDEYVRMFSPIAQPKQQIITG